MLALNAADVTLLNRIRTRQHHARFSMGLFALLTLAFVSVAAWYGLRAAELKAILDADPVQLLACSTTLTACGMSGLGALLYAGMGLSAWRQTKCDALVLKLADQRSGFPDYTR